eukprot:5432017-Amphidinium_carterae.1
MQPAWMGNLGTVYGLQRLEAHYGPDHPEVAEALGYLGDAYLGDDTKMRDYFERALRIQEAHYGPDHPR